MLTTHSKTFLTGRRFFIAGLSVAEEQIFELVHPRIGEQQRRIVMWQKGRRWEKGMTPLLKVVEIRSPNFLAIHKLQIIQDRLERKTDSPQKHDMQEKETR